MQTINKDFYINMKHFHEPPLKKPTVRVISVDTGLWYECWVDGELVL